LLRSEFEIQVFNRFAFVTRFHCRFNPQYQGVGCGVQRSLIVETVALRWPLSQRGWSVIDAPLCV
jgi:hypothetical protein